MKTIHFSKKNFVLAVGATVCGRQSGRGTLLKLRCAAQEAEESTYQIPTL